MKVLAAFLAGLVVGAVGAVAYSVQTGRDLREAFLEVRGDLSRRGLAALDSRLESGVPEMQARLEARIAQVREKGASATEEARSSVPDALARAAVEAAEAAAEQPHRVGDTAEA